MNKYSSRKFITMISWQIVFTALLIHSYITGDIYSTLTLFNLGGFYASNVGEHFANKS